MPATALPTPLLQHVQGSTRSINLPLNQDNRELYLLKELYGYDSFRVGQLEAIQSILQDKDTLVLIPTGGGKSLIYTMAAVLKQGLTIIIEPLKFIMEEQAEKLRQKQVPAFFYNSSLTDTEMEFVVNALCRQDLPFAILFTSPECIVSSKLLNILRKWNDAGNLNFIAVDEAHCIDIWGPAFRPDYLKLGLLKDFNVPIMALTGTCTNRVQNKIITTLQMESYETIQVTSSRINLHLQIQPKTDKPKKQIADFINQHCQGQCGIVYCARRKDTVDLAHELKSANINAVFVHGDLNDLERRKHERAWTIGLAQVICATKSFGMGIDRKDVRFVLHMCFSESIEDYHQEIGRAGRDGLPALCTLFFKHEDRSFHLHNILKIEDKDYQEHKYNMMNKMVNYCDSGSSRRHRCTLSYFEEVSPECEEHCDICIGDIQSQKNCTIVSQLIIKGLVTILEVQKKVTVLLLSQFLLGSSASELKALSLDVAHGFRSAKPYYQQRTGRKQLQRLIYHLIVKGIIKEEMAGTTEKPTILLNKGNTEKLMDNKEIILF
jgi:RecQ family ATP-dependent DNA helicase